VLFRYLYEHLELLPFFFSRLVQATTERRLALNEQQRHLPNHQQQHVVVPLPIYKLVGPVPDQYHKQPAKPDKRTILLAIQLPEGEQRACFFIYLFLLLLDLAELEILDKEKVKTDVLYVLRLVHTLLSVLNGLWKLQFSCCFFLL
jgi:hypothetical protein